jgi:hypothetical protein
MKREHGNELRELAREADKALSEHVARAMADPAYVESIVREVVKEHATGMVGTLLGLKKSWDQWEVDSTNGRVTQLGESIAKLAAKQILPLVEEELAEPKLKQWTSLIRKAHKSILEERDEEVYRIIHGVLSKRADQEAQLEAERILREEFAVIGAEEKDE